MSEAGRIVPSQRQTARWEYYLQNLRSRRYSEFLSMSPKLISRRVFDMKSSSHISVIPKKIASLQASFARLAPTSTTA